MSKKDKKIKEEIEVPASITLEGEEIDLHTKKTYLKQAAKLVKRMQNTFNSVVKASTDASDLVSSMNTTDVSEKDQERFVEMENVLHGVEVILKPLVERMNRKYGK